MKKSSLNNSQVQSFQEGAKILVYAVLAVKIIGAAFKIPLGSILREEGFAYFNVAYNLFTPLYSLAMAGLPVAVARMVSEQATKGNYRDVKKILRISTAAFTITGALGSIIMLASAGAYAGEIVKIPAAFLSIISLAPAVFFCCMMSSRRGYYEGLKNMKPTAISQVLEAAVKLVFGMLLSWLVMHIGTSQFAANQTVFGTYCSTEKEALSIIYPFASAAAILGVTLSTLIGALYLHIRYKIKGDTITNDELLAAPPAQSGKSILKALMVIAVPVSLGTLTTTITTFIDSTLIPNRLDALIKEAPDVIISMYPGIENAAVKLPDFIYGAYCYGLNIFNLVPTITTALAVSALPHVTSAWTSQDRALTKKSIEDVLRLTSLVALPAGIGMSVLAKPILMLLYPTRVVGIQIAAPALAMLGIAVIFVGLMTTVNSMLQAVGRADVPVKLMLIGGTIKIVTNVILVSIPEINVKGAPVGTLLCYIFLFIASMICLCKQTGMVPNIKATLLKPFLCAAACGVGAAGSYYMLSMITDSRIVTVISIILAAVIYAICLLISKTLTKDDINMLPMGKKFVKILEKRGWIE